MDVDAWKWRHFHVSTRSPKATVQWQRSYQENRISNIDVTGVLMGLRSEALYIHRVKGEGASLPISRQPVKGRSREIRSFANPMMNTTAIRRN